MARGRDNMTGICGLYWLFAVVWTFMKWGFWWGFLCIFIPVFPMIDLVKYLISKYPGI